MQRAGRLDGLTVSKLKRTNELVNELEKSGKTLVKFTFGEPDFPTPQYIVDACKAAIDAGFTKYPDYHGSLSFRQAVCDKYERENDLKFEPEQVISTVGAAQAVYLVMTSFLNEGDEVLIPNPSYNIYKTNAKICGAVVKEYSLLEENGFQPDPEELAELLTERTKMLVLCSPSNPCGSVVTRETLSRIAELLDGRDVLVCSDEIYERLTYDGVSAVSPAAVPELRERTFVINGFSKAFAMTGWRLGYVIAPREAAEALYLHTGQQVSGVTSFILEAGAAALSGAPEYGTVETMREAFDLRRRFLVSAINGTRHFSCRKPQGAFYIFMNIKKTGMDSDAFCDWLLRNYGMAVVTGNNFGSEGEGYVRLSYAASMETCKQAAEILRRADEDLRKNCLTE